MEQFQGYYQDLAPIFQNLILIIAAVLGGLLIKSIIFSILRFAFRNHQDAILIHSLLTRCSAVLNFLVPLITLSLTLPLMDTTPRENQFLEKTLGVLMIIGFAWLAIKIIYVAQDYINDNFDIEAENNFLARKVRTQVQFIRKLLIIGVVVITLSVLLLSFESVRTIGAGLLTSAGVTGIIIGFAAQKSIANLIAGFQIAFTQPIRIDDVVIVEGEFGRIEEITLTYVVIRLWDLRRLVVPINYFIEKPFQNWTRQSTELLGTVFLYTDYYVPLKELRAELRRLCEASPHWDKKVCVLQVTETTETAIQLRVLVSALNSGNAWELRVYLREKLVEYIRDNYPESLPVTRAEIRSEDGKQFQDTDLRQLQQSRGVQQNR
ncbi:mechanosensitive ion channel family protein [Cesiribacter sp. SM1]|uniref:mechanosensitive ion channel family protein n=1 Tax=Cesiribacter sp. SM1 TaxID=2861196 RepID=UPI001CD3CEB6|nr:mechanosensitive ion channel domain-containing protein [Cesiribacter sp. SM1]